MLKRLSKKLTLTLAMTASSMSVAADLTEHQKLRDFYQLVSLIEAQYGPKIYKKDRLGLDIDRLSNTYESLVKSTSNNGEFYYTMVKFVAEFKDGHFSIMVPSDKVSTLGFSTDLVEGKVLIDEINKVLLPGFDFQHGDEIVTFNGQPVRVEIEKLRPFVSNGNENTITRVAAISLPTRRAARVPAPQGSVELGIQRVHSDKVEFITLEWRQIGNGLDEGPNFFTEPQFFKQRNFLFPAEMEYNQISTKDIMADLETPQVQTFRCSGATRTAIPDDATILSTKPFVAYYHPTPKGNIGYLRIPHYSFEEAGVSKNETVFNQYAYVVDQLEKNTVGLVIDQDHNCGGSVELVEKMASLFIPKEYPGLEFQLLSNKPEYLEFKSWVDQSPENTFERAGTEQALNLILASWKKGNYLTPKTSFHGNLTVKPFSNQYTKPIILLADEMSGSGGDAFPGLMQGNHRAKIVGSRTMGLGGHVIEVPGLYNSGLGLRMTKSLFFRPDGTPIENNGVEPDIPYAPTQNDFINQYRDYQKFYLNELYKLIDQTASTTTPS